MVFWFKRKKPFNDYRSYELPGKVGTVLLPAEFKVEMEDDSTLLAYPVGQERISLRFSSLSIVSPDRKNAGEQQVRNKALEKNIECNEFNGKFVLTYEEESEEQGDPLVMRFSEVGILNNIIIISATIIKNQRNHSLVKLTLDAIPKIIDSIQVTKEYRVIESEDKKITVTEQVVEPTPQTITPFGKEQEHWLSVNLAHARELGTKYGSGGELHPDELDCIFSRWMEEETPKEDDELIANALGAAFGDWLVQEHDFRWVIVEDIEFGSEYAVRHCHREAMAYPRASVQKRIESGQCELFKSIYLIILDQFKEAKEDTPEKRRFPL